jgi:hypothetical protein
VQASEIEACGRLAGLQRPLLACATDADGRVCVRYRLLHRDSPDFEARYELLSCKWATWISHVRCQFISDDDWIQIKIDFASPTIRRVSWIVGELKRLEAVL